MPVAGTRPSFRVLVVRDGHVAECGPAAELLPKLRDVEIKHYADALSAFLRADAEGRDRFEVQRRCYGRYDFRLVVNPFYLADRYSFTGKPLNTTLSVGLLMYKNGFRWCSTQ